MNITYLGQQTAQSDSPANKQWLFAATTDPIYDDGPKPAMSAKASLAKAISAKVSEPKHHGQVNKAPAIPSHASAITSLPSTKPTVAKRIACVAKHIACVGDHRSSSQPTLPSTSPSQPSTERVSIDDEGSIIAVIAAVNRKGLHQRWGQHHRRRNKTWAVVNAPTLRGKLVLNARRRCCCSHGRPILILIVRPSTQRAWANERKDRRIQIWIYSKWGQTYVPVFFCGWVTSDGSNPCSKTHVQKSADSLSYDIVLIDAIIFPPANLVMLEIRHGY